MPKQTIDDEIQKCAQVPIGAVFEHYSGKKYKILEVARHSETLELCVVYQGLYECPTFGSQPIWVRPLSLFLETVFLNGQQQPRFRRIVKDLQ